MASRFTEFRFGWPVVVASALGIGLGMSPLPFYTIGVFAKPLMAEFGWGVDQVMLGLPLFTLGALIMSPIIGLLTDKFGARRVAIVSLVSFSLAMMSFALGNGTQSMYLLQWCLLAISGAGTLPITWTRVVNSWFDERRGLALGFSLVGTGLFGAFAKVYAHFMIEELGWRGAYVAVGALPLLIALPIAYFLFYDATDPKMKSKIEKRAVVAPELGKTVFGGLSLPQALRDWRYWLLAYSFVPISFAVGGPIPNLETIFSTKGFDTRDGVILASLIGYSVVVGRVAGGYLLDRLWAPAVAATILSLPALAVVFLSQPDISFVVAAISVMLLGLAAGVEYDLMAYLVSRYFGLLHYGAIYGALYGFFAMGAGIGPYVFARAYEATGSYDSVLLYSAIAFLAGALPLLLLGKYRDYTHEAATVK